MVAYRWRLRRWSRSPFKRQTQGNHSTQITAALTLNPNHIPNPNHALRHSEEMDRVKTQHGEEMDRVKTQHSEEMDRVKTQVEEEQAEVSDSDSL